MRIGLVVDSPCDLPESYLQAHQISILPTTVRMGSAVLEDYRKSYPAAWERLVQVDPAAERVALAEAATLPARAWRSILEGIATTGENPFDGLVLLHRADPDAYALLVDGDAQAAPAPASGSIPRLVEALDRVAGDA